MAAKENEFAKSFNHNCRRSKYQMEHKCIISEWRVKNTFYFLQVSTKIMPNMSQSVIL